MREHRAKPPAADPSERLAADYVPNNRRDARDFVAWASEHLEPWDQPSLADWPALTRRQRRASVTTLIKRARQAGERGPVRVELPDGTAITSEREAGIAQMTDANAADDWRGLQ